MNKNLKYYLYNEQKPDISDIYHRFFKEFQKDLEIKGLYEKLIIKIGNKTEELLKETEYRNNITDIIDKENEYLDNTDAKNVYELDLMIFNALTEGEW